MSFAVPISLAQFMRHSLAAGSSSSVSLIRALFAQRSRDRRQTATGARGSGSSLQSIGIRRWPASGRQADLCLGERAGFAGTAVVRAAHGRRDLLCSPPARANSGGTGASLRARAAITNWSAAGLTRACGTRSISAMLLFLLALAVALGHWLQLLVAMPLFLAGTAIRTRLEDGLLEQQFGEAFRDYAASTPGANPEVSRRLKRRRRPCPWRHRRGPAPCGPRPRPGRYGPRRHRPSTAGRTSCRARCPRGSSAGHARRSSARSP